MLGPVGKNVTMINATILNYSISRIIGKGGMATVYEARHTKLGNKVAIKILDPSLSADPQIRNRFENEAKAMAALSHSNIMKVIDYEESGNNLAIVMEFSEGEDLNQLIKVNGRLPANKAVLYFTQILSAINYAHGKGIIHRDIKPSNIFIEQGDHVKILDFGIAKILETSGELTQTGFMLGTPVYMSPEQVKGEKDLDFRTDIYSLGVTLYFMTHGKPPYDVTGTSIYTIQTKIVNESVPGLNSSSPVDRIIEKATQKKKEDRYNSCSEMKADVERSLKESVAEQTLIDNRPSHDRIIDPNLYKKRKKRPVYAFLIIIPVILIAAFFIVNSSNNKAKRTSGEVSDTTRKVDIQSPAAGGQEKITTIIPAEKNRDISNKTVKQYRDLFEGLHQALANQDVQFALSYYADYVHFYDKYVSRDEIGNQQSKTYEKYTPAGTQVLSFTPAPGNENVFDYYLDYKLSINNSYPAKYKKFKIHGLVQFDENDKISRIKDESTVQY